MTLEDFIIAWQGKPIDFDGVYPNQCMDLMHFYIYQVLNITDKAVLAAPTAKDVYLNFPNIGGSGYFDKIDNSPTGVPLEGDIVFFGTGVGPAGHVCIFHDGDANNFKSFDANWPTGSLPHIQDHTYGYCLGWLHPKAQAPDIQGQLNACISDRDSHWNDLIAIADRLKVEHNTTVILAEIDKLVTVQQAVLDKDKQIADIQKQATDLQTQLTLKEQAILDVQAQVATLTVEVGKAQQTIDTLTKQTKDDQTQLADLQQAAKIYSSLTGFRKWVFDHFIR